MATLEIKVTNSRTGQITCHESYDLTDDLGRQLIEQLDQMIVDLPGAAQIKHLTRLADRATVVDISLGPTGPPTPAVSFQQQHYLEGQPDDND
jgi:hypothetical protein